MGRPAAVVEQPAVVAERLAAAKREADVLAVELVAEQPVVAERLAVVEKLIAGIPERMRLEGAKKTPFAALSRGICGVREKSLLLNLPGSPTAAAESLQAVLDILPHALELLSGNTEH